MQIETPQQDCDTESLLCILLFEYHEFRYANHRQLF